MSPSAGSPISVLRFETPLGTMMGGATDAGVCLCEFADRGGETGIISRLERRHGLAAKRPSQEGPAVSAASNQNLHLHALQGQLREYFAGTRTRFALELDLGGTPWQNEVWSALLQIPYGTTIGYGELAARLGKPGGSRAVGRANGDNYVAIVVPCHRVVQANGNLRGYGGGLARKRWLLDFESGSQQLSL